MPRKRSSKPAKASWLRRRTRRNSLFVAADGAEDDRQYGPLLGQIAQDAVMGGQVRPLRADLARAERAHDGRHAAFDDQLDLGPSHAALRARSMRSATVMP